MQLLEVGRSCGSKKNKVKILSMSIQAEAHPHQKMVRRSGVLNAFTPEVSGVAIAEIQLAM
jgi:purine-nucleoside phosphorylase